MYTKNNTIYCDANSILKLSKPIPDFVDEEGNEVSGGTETAYAYQFEASKAEYITEEAIDLASVVIKGDYAYFNNGKVALKIDSFDKKTLKMAIIAKRYGANDDTTIILNKDMNDETQLAYNKMQEWYEFADAVADAILTAKGIVEEKTLQSVKDDKLAAIAKYDKSEAVNGFTYQGATMWIDKATRVGMMNAANASKAIGNETITVGISGLSVTMPVDTLIGMLYQLEMYALSCYNKTLEHKNNVLALSTIEGVEAYDFTTGYPEKLNF